MKHDRTLVLRALGLGDLLTAVPALRAVRRARPADEIVLAAPSALSPLISLTGAVDTVLDVRGLGVLRDRVAEGSTDVVLRPRLAVNLHGKGPASIADLLATRPSAIVTHRHPDFPELDGPRWRDDVHEVRRWCALLDEHGIATDPGELRLPPPTEPSPAPGAVLIHPGAASAARRWPAERFAALARALAEAGGHPGAPGRANRPVLVTGGEAERALAVEVATRAGLGPDAVFAGQDLARMAALVAGAALVVCGDTGVGHLATAFGTPSVLLFGPTPPARWGPPEDRPQHLALWAGDTGDPHAATPHPGLLRLTVDSVIECARTLLSGGDPCPPSTPGMRAGSPSVSSVPATSD